MSEFSLRLRMPSGWGEAKKVTSGTGEDWTARLQPAKKGATAKDVLMLLGGGVVGLPKLRELTSIVVEF